MKLTRHVSIGGTAYVQADDDPTPYAEERVVEETLRGGIVAETRRGCHREAEWLAGIRRGPLSLRVHVGQDGTIFIRSQDHEFRMTAGLARELTRRARPDARRASVWPQVLNLCCLRRDAESMHTETTAEISTNGCARLLIEDFIVGRIGYGAFAEPRVWRDHLVALTRRGA